MPIGISLLEGRNRVKGARFHLGAFGYVCNVVAVGKSITESTSVQADSQ